MKRFEFKKSSTNGATFIKHNLYPRIEIQVIKNNNFPYDEWEDVYNVFEFRCNEFAFVVVWAEVDLDELDDYHLIQSILKRAWNWYKNNVYIEKYTPTDTGIMEDDNYIIQESKQKPNWWICTDKKNNIIIEFKNGMFNETQKVVSLYEQEINKKNITEIARMMRKIEEWLSKNHESKL